MEKTGVDLDGLSSLQSAGKLTPTNVDLLEGFRDKWNKTSYDSIIDTKLMREEDLEFFFSSYFETLIYVESDDQFEKNPELLVPCELAKRFGVFPLGKSDDGKKKILIFDPTNPETMNYINENIKNPQIYISTKSKLLSLINQHYSLFSQVPQLKDLMDRPE